MTEVQAQTPAAGLFQKAHGKIVMLQRLDTQIATLLGQRKRVQDELTGVQGLINEELHRVMTHSDELPAKILSEISGAESETVHNGEVVA